MLSRVAAVKAPRTHNRRGVTGSSGRRREGGESEPQRPNVSRSLFTSAVLLLLVVMMCCNAGGVAEQAEEQASERNYKWKDIKEGEGETVESLGAPGLLKVGSDVFAVAEARCKKSLVSFTGIASQLLTTQNVNAPMEVLKDPKETQFLEEDGSEGSKKKVDVSRPTTVVKGNDIYMIAGSYSPTAATDQDGGAEDGGLLLVKGEVSEESGSGKRIKWSDANAVPRASVGELDSWTGLIGGGGSGIKTDDGRLVFPVEGTKKGESNDEKTVSLLIYTLKDNAASWKLSKGMSDGGCSDPSVVEWKDKKIIMMTACDDGRRRVYESGDMGDSWTEALGTLSRVWGNKKDKGAKAVRSGFITATIDGEDNRNVMLVTLPVYAKEEDGKKETDNGKGKLHLWLTDNTHIVDIGPVSDDDAAASSLLYRSGKSETNNEKEKLIALYEKKKGDDEKPSPGMVSVLLTEQLQRVKDVLATWKEADDIVSKLCLSSAEEDGSPSDACSPPVKVTDGLVGFLSDNFSENTWRDEYLGVNATVRKKDGETGATKISDGVTFKGAWAEWPVGSQGENQLYHFANYNFTLVATVSIDKVPEEGDTHIPLMGVKMNDNEKTVLLGLSYDSEKKRIVLCGGGQNKDHSSNWEPGRTRQLAIVLRDGTQGSAYVDGQRVGGDVPCALGNKDSEAVSHFYIGGDGNSAGGAGRQEEVSVTVRNVLLYNRPLSTAEIGALNPNKASSPSVLPDNGQGTVPQSSSAGQLPSEQGQQKGSIAAGAGGASTLATSTAAASSGQEPVKQLTSGTSPSGNKNVDVSSSSDADATVTPGTSPDGGQTANGGSTADSEPTTETREGGTNGQEKEEVNSQDGEVNAAALSSSLGNVSQGNNSDAGTVCGSGLLPSLLLLLGLWVFAAL
ncbi:trans-sialidase [Trypanosoma cruzi cruzi]|uniref:Putative trans-sialidase, Group V n=1 Tax=Trypanosoma cruzi TaxID=5693 RepID=A0A2V2VC27_TRYCR|nr:trans-sialidase [Trypanosoma cruzi cruzi]PWU92628.1 putative trans-sialidase, Group V [Trypanosoma cruzi]